MEYIGFVQFGDMFEYRSKVKEIGKIMSFKRGIDVLPFLKRNDLVLYIDTGMLYYRLCKPDGTYLQLMAYKEGNILPVFQLEEEMVYSDVQMLVAARGDVTGFVFSRSEFRKLRETEKRFADLLQTQVKKTHSYLLLSQLLYRDGTCITRISNLLYHVYCYKDYDSEIFPIGQEELACTIGVSKSQVKRALSQLKYEGAIELKYEQIVIKDISIIKKHVSDSMQIELVSKKD